MKKEEILSNSNIALFALYKLGGISKKIHTEHIAWEAYNMAKDKFSWSLPEFRERGFPDKTTVRYALESAKKLGLVEGRAGKDKAGSGSEGWQFTSKGSEFILTREKKISLALNDNIPISNVMPKHQAERFVKKIRAEKLFKAYEKSPSLNSVTEYDFTDMLNCTPDAPVNIIRQKFDIMKSIANLINDDQIKQFFIQCEDRFKEFIVSQT